MNTNREICIVEGLLLCTWFLLDVQTINPEGQNIFTTGLFITFMIVTALYIVSFWIRKSKSFVSLVGALWKSSYFDAMVSISIGLPWMAYAFESEKLHTYLCYASWALAAITFLIGFMSKRDRTIRVEETPCP